MDPTLLTLATSSANALISLMATDIWERAKSGVAHLFARWSGPAGTIEEELEQSRNALSDSSARGDLEDTTIEMQQEWKGKFRRLLSATPEAADELRGLISLWKELSPDAGVGVGEVINQTATAYDNSRIYQQGSGIQYNN